MWETNNDSKGLYARLLVRLLIVITGGFFILFLLPKAVRILMPFVIAFIVGALLNPFVDKINRKLGISRRIIALLLDLLVFTLVAFLLGLLIYSVINEAIALATNVQLNWESITAGFEGLENSFAWLIDLLPPQVVSFLEGFEESISGFIQNISKDLISGVISATTAISAKTGNFFISFIMAILAAYFIISDYNLIAVWVNRAIGPRFGRYVSILKQSIFTALGGYFRSQLLLALFAFLFMFVALTVYGQPYALLIALGLGFIDFLPIVGTIALLVPWSLIEMAGGDINKGIFLLVIGVVFFLVRKMVEPKIVGSQTGLHPLAALISTFVGLQFSGVWGAILGPVILMLAVSIFKSGILDNTIADLKEFADNISVLLSRKDGKNAGGEDRYGPGM